jgi:pimeloyl-ACP methyl ester carboxylesterase
VTPATVRLRDGRAVAYEEYGDPAGFPVLNCHGGLLCRFDVEPSAALAAELGLRVVSPDRPGVGRSDRHPDASTADWAEDAEQLLDTLGIDRCAVMGWSAGGQYALGVAARLAARVTHTAVIAGCVPLDDPARRAELSKLDRRFVWLSTRAPWAARAVFSAVGRSAARHPDRTTQRSVAGLPEAERDAVLATGDWMGRTMAEAMHDPRGQVDDYRAFVAPWGFTPEDVGGPVTLWQGDRDRLVPARWATMLAAHLPDARVVDCPGEDHFTGLTRRPDVLRALAATAP